jgi:hypothetical protein
VSAVQRRDPETGDLTHFHHQSIFAPLPFPQNTKATGFNPARSQVNHSEMLNWLRAPINGDLQEVPGIGESSESRLVTIFRNSQFHQAHLFNTSSAYSDALCVAFALAGPVNAKHLKDPSTGQAITTTQQLIGYYLSLK